MKAKAINIDSSKQEITQHISGFPVSCYISEFRPDTYDCIDWHWHVEFQLCLTLRGTVVWGAESQQIPVPRGCGIFINSQRTHMARPRRSDGEAAYFCVDFPPDFICPEKESRLYEESVQPILDETGLQMKLLERDDDSAAQVLDELEMMADVFASKHSGYEFDLAGGLFRLWKILRVILEKDLRRETRPADNRFREMLLFLQKNYSQDIQLEDIAGHVGLSRSECCRCFRKCAGQTISDYLRQYRIHKSMEMLAVTDSSVSEISQNCGFSHQSYFTKRFRELTGMTPREYRLSSGEMDYENRK